MPNTNPNTNSLKPWKPGQSGNPKGRPKGAVGLKTVIRNMTEDGEIDWRLVPIKNFQDIEKKYGSNAWVAIVYVAIGKAMSGDIRAMEWLRKSQYGDKIDFTSEDKPTLPLFVYDFSPPKKAKEVDKP